MRRRTRNGVKEPTEFEERKEISGRSALPSRTIVLLDKRDRQRQRGHAAESSQPDRIQITSVEESFEDEDEALSANGIAPPP
jgi:hypothetical protein